MRLCLGAAAEGLISNFFVVCMYILLPIIFGISLFFVVTFNRSMTYHENIAYCGCSNGGFLMSTLIIFFSRKIHAHNPMRAQVYKLHASVTLNR